MCAHCGARGHTFLVQLAPGRGQMDAKHTSVLGVRPALDQAVSGYPVNESGHPGLAPASCPRQLDLDHAVRLPQTGQHFPVRRTCVRASITEALEKHTTPRQVVRSSAIRRGCGFMLMQSIRLVRGLFCLKRSPGPANGWMDADPFLPAAVRLNSVMTRPFD